MNYVYLRKVAKRHKPYPIFALTKTSSLLQPVVFQVLHVAEIVCNTQITNVNLSTIIDHYFSSSNDVKNCLIMRLYEYFNGII
jgi:hypothetical protein